MLANGDLRVSRAVKTHRRSATFDVALNAHLGLTSQAITRHRSAVGLQRLRCSREATVFDSLGRKSEVNNKSSGRVATHPQPGLTQMPFSLSRRR